MKKINFICLAVLSFALLTAAGADAKSFLDVFDETLSSVNSGDVFNENITTVIQGAGNKISEITNNTVITIENGKKSINRIGNEQLKSVSKDLGKTVDNVSMQVNGTLQQVERAIGKMNEDLNRVSGEIDKTIGNISGDVKASVDGVKSVTTTSVNNAGDAVINTVNSVNSGVTRIIETEKVIDINNGAAVVTGRINETLSDAGNALNSAGVKINETVEAVNSVASNTGGRINEVIDSVNETINPLSNVNANQSAAVQQNSTGLNTAAGDPENVFSEKALEGFALLGNKWAKLKLDEMRAKKVEDTLYNNYKTISWFNIFKKLDAYSDYKNAKNYHVMMAEEVRRYELANPGSGSVVQGIDQINESVLEFKALFGDKKARAQLEAIKAKREYDKIKLQYDSAGLFEKLKYKSQLEYARTRYEEAVKVFENLNRTGSNTAATVNNSKNNTGATIANNSNNITTTTTTITTINNSGNKIITVNDELIFNQNGKTVISSDNSSGYVNPSSVASAKANMDAAYKKYIDYMSQSNPSKSKLDQLYNEYVNAIEVFQNTANGR